MPTGYKNIGDGLFVSRTGKVWSERANRHIGEGARAIVNYYGTSVQTAHLVADAFCEHPQGATIVHHIDGNPANNSAKNLMWVTYEEHVKIHAAMRKEMMKHLNKPKIRAKILAEIER